MVKTLIVVVLDESGSMNDKKGETLGGFNGFVEQQKQVANDSARLYLVKFNTGITVVHNGVPLECVPKLTAHTYRPGGATALFDAIAMGVHLAERDKKCDERVVCVIMTDGEENSSRETTRQQVRDIISGREARGDWTFLYIGEKPERWALETGMSGNNAVAYDHRRPLRQFAVVSDVVQQFRNMPALQSLTLFKK